MMTVAQKLISTGVLFLLTIGTGIWLSNLGKPYNELIFNIHKLIALGTVIFSGVFIRNLLINGEIKTRILIFIVLLTFFIILLFVSGALLSANDKIPYVWLKIIHIVATVLALFTASGILYLLTERS